jgi:hypothetical protein
MGQLVHTFEQAGRRGLCCHFTTGHFQDFRSFNGAYALSGLNNELTISVSNALMETSEVCHQICPVEKLPSKRNFEARSHIP